ncbi:MAG: efflux RND transporter periplasmic adaptor subunit, partial [Vicinamibacterales bacterium]|nr:efflux RND transporter periplasmic adaptor subunit [Vicinamibacterales bacterium]
MPVSGRSTSNAALMRVAAGLPVARCPRSLLVAAAAAVLLMAACTSGPDPRQGRGGAQGVPVKTTSVLRMSVQRQIDLAGTLLSPDQARVSAEAAGVVRRVSVEIGREVAVGTPLVQIEPRELALALERAEAALRQTRAQLGIHGGDLTVNEALPPDETVASVRTATANRDDAKAAYERAMALNARGITSSETLLTAETRYKVADSALQAALDSVRATKALLQDRRAAYELAVKKLGDAVVRAPIAGVVAERPVQVGEFISERTVVATIVQMHPLKLRTGVQERHAGVVKAGQPVEFRVEAFGDRVFKGAVAYISPSLDQTMRTFTVEALVDNAERLLKPGFFAKGVILTHRDDNVMAVPDAAVSVLAGVSSVYVIKDNLITQQSVALGVRQGDLWEISSGLNGDEVLAASRLNELATGVTVTLLKEGETESASGPGGGEA